MIVFLIKLSLTIHIFNVCMFMYSFQNYLKLVAFYLSIDTYFYNFNIAFIMN